MPAEATHLEVMSGMEIMLGAPERGAAALVHVCSDLSMPVIPAGPYALKVAMSMGCLRSLLGRESNSYNYVAGLMSRDGTVHVAVRDSLLVCRISDDIRHSRYSGAGRVLYLQGKALELLAVGLQAETAKRVGENQSFFFNC